MISEGISKLTRVPLREVWKHEAHDFTQWLQLNIDVLNEALDITLINVDRERSAGDFAADLVAEEEGGGTVIIENQLERSNHDHLGKVITYLAAMGAQTAIWLVSDPRPEHVAAIGWLNESSSVSFYMVKVEAVRIAGSPAAPLFTRIVGPSMETKSAGETKHEIAERYGLRKQWWTALLALASKVTKLHSHISPNKDTWISTSSGIRGLNLNYVVNQESFAAELYIDRGKNSEQENKRIFDQLFDHRSEIENSFGGALLWERRDGKQGCRIRYQREEGGYRSPEEKWTELQTPVVEAMVRLERSLRPFLTQLKLGA